MRQSGNDGVLDTLLANGMDALAVGITLLDAELRLVYWNPAIIELYRLPEGLLHIGMALDQLLKFRAERGDFGEHGSARDTRERLRNARLAQCLEEICPDGKVVEVHTTPLPDGGIVVTHTDVTRLRNVARSLSESEERYHELANLAPVLICVHSDGILRYINPAGARMLGAAKPDQLIGRHIETLVHPACHGDLRAGLSKLEPETHAMPRMEHRYLRLDGSEIEVEVAVRPFRQQERIAFLTVAREITERKRAERQMRAILDASPMGVLVVNAQGNVLYSNTACAALFTPRREQSPGFLSLFQGQPEQFDAIKRHLLQEEVYSQELDLKRGSDASFCALVTAKRLTFEDAPAYFLWIVDISEQKRIRQQLSHLAHYDELTGLPNRRHFLDHTKRAIALANRTGQRCALLYFDLDGFKAINDALGHEAGDHLLREVASRFQECLRSNDLVARIGGDEFAALLMDIKRSQDATSVAQKIVDLASMPVLWKDRRFSISTSVGVACFPDGSHNVDELIARADRAMYAAKQAGKGRYCLMCEEDG